MAIPAAPTELGGAKMIFLIYDNAGDNDPAILRGVAPIAVNGETLASLGIATHGDAETFDVNDPVVVIAGVENGAARRLSVDASGRLVGRPGLAYDGGSAPAFAHQRALGEAALEGEQAAAAQVATHLNGATFGATDPVVMLAGLFGTVVKRLAVDTDGRLLIADDPAFGGAGHKNTDGTAKQFKTASTPCRRIKIKADPGNAATVYIGAATVTANDTEATGGFQLAPGQETDWPVANVDQLYVIGTNADGVSFAWFV
jgi:hypothetical protein